MEVLEVLLKSSPNAVIGSLSRVIRERFSSEMQSIGSGTLNQAVKAIAMPGGFAARIG